MSDGTKIGWTEATWPVTTGCEIVSSGCDLCYAARLTSGRLKRLPEYAHPPMSLRSHGDRDDVRDNTRRATVKRSVRTGQTVVVYRYGCPSWARLPEVAERQLRLAHELRNELVEVELRYLEMQAGIWRLVPDVDAAHRALDEATQRVDQVAKSIKTDRVALRHTAATARRRSELEVARRARRDAKAALKASKAAVHATVDPLLKECGAARQAAWTQVRKSKVGAGLFWATATAVLDYHQVAAKQIVSAWKSGRPARRHFKPWDGTGTLTMQVQLARRRGVVVPRTPDVLATDGAYRNVVQLTPWSREGDWPRGRGKHRHGVFRMRVSGDADPVELPVVVDRPLPANAEVAYARITRHRIAGHLRLSVSLTVLLPAPAPPVGGVPVSVVLGWASAGDGAVRVARLGSPFGALPVPPPDQPELLELLVPGDEYVDVVVPAAHSLLLERDDRTRAHRGELLDQALSDGTHAGLQPAVVAVLAANPELATRLGVSSGEAARWRSQRRFARLARVWPASHVVDRGLHDDLTRVLARHRPVEELAGLSTVELWRRRDRHLWEYEGNERLQVLDRRRDAYRKIAAWLCGQASEVLLDSPDVAVLREAAPLGEEDTYQARAARRQVQVGAPGDLRMAIVNAARRRGVKVIDVRKEEGL